jgi:hypothetical protein
MAAGKRRLVGFSICMAMTDEGSERGGETRGLEGRCALPVENCRNWAVLAAKGLFPDAFTHCGTKLSGTTSRNVEITRCKLVMRH